MWLLWIGIGMINLLILLTFITIGMWNLIMHVFNLKFKNILLSIQ